jgi:glucokinase
VVAGRARITNLPWSLAEDELAAACRLPAVHLINDLVATAWGVPELGPEDLLIINDREPEPGGTIAVIAPGTGLGEAFLAWDGRGYRAYPSEGGHADFAPVGDEQIGLLRYLAARLEHVSYEQLCSGLGLPYIYDYLKSNGLAAEPAWIADELATAPDPTPVIVRGGLDPERPCKLCRAALDCFVSILAAEAGNLALKVLAFGGVYLGGGIVPRISELLTDGRFMAAFTRKGRMAQLVASMPVRLITNPKAALLGAAAYGQKLIDASG